MQIWQIICAFGIPSTLLTALIALIVSCINACKALKKGVQAMLRSEMIKMYAEYSKVGYAPISVRENFENCWLQYEALGANGVMQDVHDRFMALPIYTEL